VAGGRLHAEDGTLVCGEEDRLEPGATAASARAPDTQKYNDKERT
jgi:hypothetical protein